MEYCLRTCRIGCTAQVEVCARNGKRVTGPGFSSTNQPDQERTTVYRDSSGPNSRSDAHYATILGDWEKPSGKSQLHSAQRPAHGNLRQRHAARIHFHLPVRQFRRGDLSLQRIASASIRFRHRHMDVFTFEHLGQQIGTKPRPFRRIHIAFSDIRQDGDEFLVPAGVEGAHRLLD